MWCSFLTPTSKFRKNCRQRVARNEEDASWDKAERTANQRRASAMLDAEQSRRVAEAAALDADAQKEREENQKKAIDAMEAERERRSSLSLQADQAAQLEAERNRKASIEKMEKERRERVSETGTSVKASPLKSCFNALKENAK